MDYVAGQVKVEAGLLADYDWAGRSIERHRAQIRARWSSGSRRGPMRTS
ncbi:MAG: transposase [Actinoallomurus sp.]|nr:transposase [Actinoallomurus sp.]